MSGPEQGEESMDIHGEGLPPKGLRRPFSEWVTLQWKLEPKWRVFVWGKG